MFRLLELWWFLARLAVVWVAEVIVAAVVFSLFYELSLLLCRLRPLSSLPLLSRLHRLLRPQKRKRLLSLNHRHQPSHSRFYRILLQRRSQRQRLGLKRHPQPLLIRPLQPGAPTLSLRLTLLQRPPQRNEQAIFERREWSGGQVARKGQR